MSFIYKSERELAGASPGMECCIGLHHRLRACNEEIAMVPILGGGRSDKAKGNTMQYRGEDGTTLQFESNCGHNEKDGKAWRRRRRVKSRREGRQRN
jgi:hypothetical protein